MSEKREIVNKTAATVMGFMSRATLQGDEVDAYTIAWQFMTEIAVGDQILVSKDELAQLQKDASAYRNLPEDEELFLEQQYKAEEKCAHCGGDMRWYKSDHRSRLRCLNGECNFTITMSTPDEIKTHLATLMG